MELGEDKESMEEKTPFAEGRLQAGMAQGRSLRWVAADLSQIVEAARLRLDLSPVAAAALGRCLTGAALLLRLLAKTPSRLVLEVVGKGPLRRILAEADEEGNLRGMVGQPRVDLPPTASGKLPVGQAVGPGTLRVNRDYGKGSYQSQVELVSGEIGEDLAHYLAQSEQIRSAVLLGVLAKPEGVAGAGGIIIEALPQATSQTLDTLQENIRQNPSVSRMLEAGGVNQVLDSILATLESEVLEVRPLRYRCRCNRERLLEHLILLAAEHREGLQDAAGRVDVECVFCGSRYQFRPEELRIH